MINRQELQKLFFETYNHIEKLEKQKKRLPSADVDVILSDLRAKFSDLEEALYGVKTLKEKLYSFELKVGELAMTGSSKSWEEKENLKKQILRSGFKLKIMGTAEVGERLGWSVNHVLVYLKRAEEKGFPLGMMPRPFQRISAGWLWLAADIEEYAKSREVGKDE